MNTTLVTGAAGFIGSHVSQALLDRGERVIGLDDFNDYYNPEQKRYNEKKLLASDNFTLVEDDFRKANVFRDIFKAHSEIGTIIHLAARAGVRASIEDPQIYVETNVLGLTHLLEAIRETDRKHLVFASSSSVYGDRKEVPFSEKDRIDRPISPYAATKMAGEHLCSTYNHLYDISVAMLRFFTVYGPSGRPDMAPHKFTKKILEGETIQRYGDGSTSRDYTYIDDIVSGVISAQQFVEEGGKCEIFNLGNSSPVLLSDFIRTIEGATGTKAIIEQLPMQPGDVGRTFADVSKAKALLGYDPSTPIDVGMKSFVEWYREYAAMKVA